MFEHVEMTIFDTFIFDTFICRRVTVNPFLLDVAGGSGGATSSSGSLKDLLASVKNNPGQTKVQLSFRADVVKYEVCTDGTSSHVMYTVNIQAIVCVGTHREIKEWRIQQR